MEQTSTDWKHYMGRHPLNYQVMCKRILIEAMQLSNGNRTGAAEILGLSRHAVNCWIKKFKLTDEFRKLYGYHPLYQNKQVVFK